MARITHVAKAQQRYETVPVIDPETGEQKTTVVHRADGTAKTTKSGRPVVMGQTVEDRTKPLPPRTCESCHQAIEIGTPYKWVKPTSHRGARGSLRVRHEDCPSWRPSELTSSAALGTLYAAQEAAEDALAAWSAEDGKDALESILTDLAEGVREAAGIYEESADNMESGFGTSTSISDEIREKADTLNAQADDVESSAGDIEDWDEDQAREEVLSENGVEGDYDWDEDPEGLADDYQAKLDDWAENAREVAQGGLDAVEGV